MKPRDDKPFKLKRQNASPSLPKKSIIFKESENPFDYINLSNTIKDKSGHYIIARMGSHLQLYKRDEQQPSPNVKVSSPRIHERMKAFQSQKLLNESVGWKLHISVDPADIDTAWSIIHPILFTHQVSAVKIISPDALLKHLTNQTLDGINAKQFTIYLFRNNHLNPDQWADMIKNIEDALIENKIKPGKIPVANRIIEESNYFSYRNDTHPNTKAYISDQDAELYAKQSKDPLDAYNLIKAEDPLKNIKPFSKPKLSI